MEGGPTRPENTTQEEVKDFILYTSILPLTNEEKRLLVSLVAEKPLGELKIFTDGIQAREIIIDPTKTDVQLARELTDLFDDLYSDVLGILPDNAFPTPEPDIKMRIEFAPITPQQLH
jgi:hypothetical protein